jgi:hypothetical protein
MLHMATMTLRSLRHDFAKIETAAKRAPVKITRRGKVIGTFTAATKADAKWEKVDFTARGRARMRDIPPFDALKIFAELDARP